jgi:hypothetical protein
VAWAGARQPPRNRLDVRGIPWHPVQHVRLLDYNALALDELRCVLGSGAEDQALTDTLGALGMSSIDSEDALRRVGAHLLRQGGPVAVAGSLLVLVAGRRATRTVRLDEAEPMRFPRPIERFNPSATEIAGASGLPDPSGSGENGSHEG